MSVARKLPASSHIGEAPLFRSGHEALRFAYAYNPQQYPMTLMARMMRGPGIGSGRGLHGIEGGLAPSLESVHNSVSVST